MSNIISLSERFPERFPQAVQKPVDKTPEPVTEPTLAERLGVSDGDFFYSSWGYDQTNVDFYRVLEVTPSGKSVKVQHWTSKNIGDDMHGSMVPGNGPVTSHDGVPAPVQTKRLKDVGRAAFHINSYSNGYHWDGTPKYQTGYGLSR